MAWEYIFAKISPSVDIKLLSRQIKIKWWKKYNLELLNKSKIHECIQLNKGPKSILDKTSEKEALFLSKKQQIMAELASGTSQEEFEEKLKKICQPQDTTIEGSRESSSTHSLSNPYLKNHDLFEDL